MFLRFQEGRGAVLREAKIDGVRTFRYCVDGEGDQGAGRIDGAGWLSGCGLSGMWGVGAIMLSAGPAGWLALGISASLLMACAWL